MMTSVKMYLSCVAFAMMTAVAIGSSDTCLNQTEVRDPSFVFRTDRVSVQDLLDKEVMSSDWIMVYGSEFTDTQSYGKCNYRWTRKDSNYIQRPLICYNSKLQKCESFNFTVTWQEDECGFVKEAGVNNSLEGKFYSQDPSRYLLYETCYSKDEGGVCTERYLDVIVKDVRYQGSTVEEIDLIGLPWHQMAADLKNNFGFDFSSDKVFYYWKGPECAIDGTVISSPGSCKEFNVLVITILVFISLVHMF